MATFNKFAAVYQVADSGGQPEDVFPVLINSFSIERELSSQLVEQPICISSQPRNGMYPRQRIFHKNLEYLLISSFLFFVKSDFDIMQRSLTEPILTFTKRRKRRKTIPKTVIQNHLWTMNNTQD